MRESMTKTVDKRFRCNACHAPLGRRDRDTLSVSGAAAVLLTPAGAVVTCATCRAEKDWRPRTGRRAPSARRAVIYLGGA